MMCLELEGIFKKEFIDFEINSLKNIIEQIQVNN